MLSDGIYCPSAAPGVLAGEALEFLRWVVAYDPIWSQHSAYSGGLVGVDIDESTKAITFFPRKGY
jgi:hypothetical protein